MATRPHEYCLQVGCTFYFSRCRIVEWCIVDGAYDFPGGFVTQGEEVGKVILTERGIVTLQPQNTPILCAGVSPASKAVSVMDCTLLQCSFHCSYACFFSAAVAIAVLFYAHLFGDIQILVLVDCPDQFRSHFRVDG